MKKESKAMPKSINSKKNGQHHKGSAQSRVNTTKHSIRFLKELNGQVLVSTDEFIANRKLIHGTPEEGFRLEDGREVTVAMEIKGSAYPFERIADLLLFSLISNIHIESSRDSNFIARIQAESDIAKAFQIIWAIDDILDSDRKILALKIAHSLDYKTFLQLIDGEMVERLAEYGVSDISAALFDEYDDPQRLSNMIEQGHRAICIAQEEADSEEECIDLMFTEVTGCIMAAQLRGMKRKAAIEYAINELGPDSKKCVETVFEMLTIEKKEVAN